MLYEYAEKKINLGFEKIYLWSEDISSMHDSDFCQWKKN